MDIHSLINSHHSLNISLTGAELISWKSLKNNTPILWLQDDTFWNRTSPILFPFVGKLKNNQYQYNGERYSMNQHGFLRDRLFEVHKQSETTLELHSRSDASTKERYPFDFEFQIRYELQHDALHIAQTIINRGDSELYFALGAHPGFHLDAAIQEYSLQIPGKKELKRHMIRSGLYTGNTEWVGFRDGGFLDLHEEYFQEDAIVFKHEDIKTMRLFKGQAPLLEMEITGTPAPYWGIWKKAGAPFLCLEPWWGIADTENFEGELSEKEGMMALPSGLSHTFEYTIKTLC